MKLFLKGDRCYTDKCGFERRAYAPGQHGQARRRKLSNYGEQLREKQKVKRIYGIAERQFRGYYYKALRMKGVTGENLLCCSSAAWTTSSTGSASPRDHAEARQLVRHGHFTVNGKKVNIPSYLVRAGDVVKVREKSRKVKRIEESLGAVDRRGVPQWLELDKEKFEGRIKGMPAREDFTMPIREQLIVELYSK